MLGAQDALQKLLQKRDSTVSSSATGAKHLAQAVNFSAANASAAAPVAAADFQAVNTQPTSMQPAATLAPHVQQSAGKVTATAATPAERVLDTLQPSSAGKSGRSQTVVASEQQGSIPSLSNHSSNQGPAGVSVVDKQAVSLTAQPELYNALYAAVTAIVQQAGFSQTQPTQHSLNSYRSHIEQEPQQQQQQSVSKGMVLESCSDGHQEDQSTAGRSGTVNGPQGIRLVGPKGSSVEGTEGKTAEGGKGNDSEHLQAWQSQIQQAMDAASNTAHTC